MGMRVAVVLALGANALLGGDFEDGMALLAKEDDAGALAKWRKAASAGHAGAMFRVGWAHETGRGVARDHEEAMRWYRTAAEKGHAEAMLGIGVLYHVGLGAKQDYVEAMHWYRKAADRGNVEAMFSIGNLYDGGLGVKQDYVEAMRWCRKAADRGDTGAMRKVGSYYQRSLGVKRDYIEAMRWYRKAADRGDAEAMRMIGSFHQHGRGIAQDYVFAMYWYRNAADKGDPHAKAELQRLRDGFTDKDFVKAILIKWKAVQKAERLCQPDALHVLALLPQTLRARYYMVPIPKKGRYEASKVLVKALMSKHDIIRKTAINCLREIYGRTLLYLHNAPPGHRKERYRKWLKEIEKLRK